jgi:hypothetical protein
MSKHVPMETTNEPGILWSDFKKRFVVVLYHPETESRFFFGQYKTMPEAVRVRDAERDIGGFKTTRKPRSATIKSAASVT